MKKFVAFLLTLAMMFSLCVPAFAADATTKDVAVGMKDYQIVKCSDGVSLAFKYMENGDIVCRMIVNGEITSETTYIAALDRIEYVRFGEKVERTTRDLAPVREKVRTSLVDANIRENRAWVVAGSITYRYYVQGWPETRTLGVSYCESPGVSSEVDLNGEYRDFAELVMFVMTLLTLPQATAVEVVDLIFDRMDLAQDMINFFLPETIVEADEYKMEWKATWGDNREGSFSGSRYYVTQEGYAGRIHYGTQYFSPSAYTGRNAALAEALRSCINLYWGDGQYEIVNWG